MHSSIWVEHDGSWTWSIEDGKAFEDGHRVLARDDGFPTRGDAREAMQKAWARLLEQGEKPGRPGQTATAAKARAALRAPEWAVMVDDDILALFAEEQAARDYADAHCEGSRIERMRVAIMAR